MHVNCISFCNSKQKQKQNGVKVNLPSIRSFQGFYEATGRGISFRIRRRKCLSQTFHGTRQNETKRNIITHFSTHKIYVGSKDARSV